MFGKNTPFRKAVQRTVEEEAMLWYAKQIGPALLRARKRVGLSQAELASIMCVDETRIRDWEQGRRLPVWDKFWLLLSALQITLTLTAPSTVCGFCQTVVASPDAIRPPSA